MKEILIFGHKNPDTDSICSSIVKQILNEKNGKTDSQAVRLGNINKETEFVLNYLGIEAPELVEKVEEGQKVLLVDHNEFNQSVEGIENAKIIGVVDHHRISNFQTAEPLYYTARPYGCTATILYKDFVEKGLTIDKKEAILMASAIISDTLLLKSPTTTSHDKEALEKLAEIAGIDYNVYGLDMLKAGTDLSSFSTEEILSLDAKRIDLKEVKSIIAQVNTASIENVMEMQADIKEKMQEKIAAEGLDLFMFLITDIVNSNSQVIALGNSAKVVEKAYNVTLENDTALLTGVVSRKKQVVPIMTENA
ncbi:MAG: manganese-dependent inorganic pyrophosphatase [Clostridia bacterium]|nr:manganese-dependent inorganic pyrophosphatase [Clostridia bacterium]